MFAKRFFYVCAGLFLLALSYHFGARSAGAQVGSMVSGFATTDEGGHCRGTFIVMTPNGDIYGRSMSAPPCTGPNGALEYIGNYWSGGGPVPATRESFGALKSRYRGAPGGARAAPQDK